MVDLVKEDEVEEDVKEVVESKHEEVVAIVVEDKVEKEDVKEVVESNNVQEKEEKISLFSKFEVDKEIKFGSYVMALGIVEETKSEKEIPQEIKLVLEEVAEALSRKHALLTSMQVKAVELEMVKDPKVRVNGIKKLHEGLKTENKYAKYVEQEIKHGKLLKFEVGDLVWVYLNKDRFMAWKFGRLAQVNGRLSFQDH